jgi:Flp pilus assembly protein TadD
MRPRGIISGVAYHRSGQWTNAAAAYSQALRFNRDLLDVRFNLGCLWLDKNNPEAAKADLFAYTSRRPERRCRLGEAGQRPIADAGLGGGGEKFS